VVDNLSGKLTFIVYADPAHVDAYKTALQRLYQLQRALRQPVQIPDAPQSRRFEAKSEFGEAAFKAAVVKSKQYIFDGDIMQVVLSQRMSQPFPASPLSLYRAFVASTRRPTCSITTWATITWSVHLRKFWCDSKATPSPCARLPEHVGAA
jgi:anthranilate/para-aminobenzoate synthase component I